MNKIAWCGKFKIANIQSELNLIISAKDPYSESLSLILDKCKCKNMDTYSVISIHMILSTIKIHILSRCNGFCAYNWFNQTII